MQVRYHDHGQINDEVQQIADRELRVLDRRLVRIHEDLKALGVGLEHHQRDDRYSAKLVLSVPNREIAAAGHGVAPGPALRDAFGHLMGELDAYLARLRNEPGERAEAKFHLSAQALHRGALHEASAMTEPSGSSGDGESHVHAPAEHDSWR